MAEKEQSYIILRDMLSTNGDLELFISDGTKDPYTNNTYKVNINTQLIWLMLILKNIIKNAKFNV